MSYIGIWTDNFRTFRTKTTTETTPLSDPKNIPCTFKPMFSFVSTYRARKERKLLTPHYYILAGFSWVSPWILADIRPSAVILVTSCRDSEKQHQRRTSSIVIPAHGSVQRCWSNQRLTVGVTQHCFAREIDMQFCCFCKNVGFQFSCLLAKNYYIIHSNHQPSFEACDLWWLNLFTKRV